MLCYLGGSVGTKTGGTANRHGEDSKSGEVEIVSVFELLNTLGRRKGEEDEMVGRGGRRGWRRDECKQTNVLKRQAVGWQ